jgi:hypothetical protein
MEHDIDRLERGIRAYQEAIASLARPDDIEKLIPIWRQPGYTTPAEFYFLANHIETMVSLSQTLRGIQQAVFEGSPMVGVEQ